MRILHPKIFFRADGSTSIGLGHLVRCSALAQMLKDDFEINFCCREIPEILHDEMLDAGFNFSRINKEAEFFDLLSDNTIVILDGYHFDTLYQKKVKNSGAKLVCIDDLHDKEFFADLIINHTPGITPQDYKAQPYTQFALGLEYALLRPAFLEQAKKQRTIEKIDTLLICFGGSDPKNLNQSTLKVTMQFSKFKKIIVVTGMAYYLSNSFEKLVASDPRIEHLHSLNEMQMLDVMLEAEVAIVPASGILFEALASGCIAISGISTENQKLVYENFRNDGIIVDAGNFLNNKLYDAIAGLNDDRIKQVKFIDGQTGLKILKHFNLLRKELCCNIRQVTLADLDITFKWASNPAIRRFSFDQHEITRQEHTHWLLKKIKDPACYYFILEYNQEMIGSIRFDIQEEKALISYLVDPAYQGKGFGQLILKKGIEWLLIVNNPDISPFRVIRGLVIKTNIASIKTFERLGFTKTEYPDYYKFEKNI